ncbi:peptide deformylase [Legionella cardiaca]|uniref:Peptide deformylase n=1 Tax=Legionella cardiaca TaxID=1071983 RepID=A0ABY8ASQ9_9GAMM|nr:peptide deformylase [Legionella cardiaca]WED43241.1 peptide deformylase [Legionella cardiaca]
MRIILKQDNPILREKAEPVSRSDFGSAWLKSLIIDMIEIMKDKGAVGIAAPQIGISKRIIVFGTTYTKTRKIDEHIPDTVLINPTVKNLSEEIQTGYEGCLNTGELRGEVPRAMEIEYSGFDLNGNFIKKRASGLEARILQHEVDHLDGFLFFDHIANHDSLITATELQKRLEL